MKRRHCLSDFIETIGEARALGNGETLFRQGDAPLGLFEVASGRIRLVRFGSNGGETHLYTAREGEIFAEASLFSATYHCDAIAAQASSVRFYPKAAILAALDVDRGFARDFMATLARQVMSLRMRLEQRDIKSAQDRLMHYLEVNAEAGGQTFRLEGALKDIAAEIGLSHEALYRTMKQLEIAGRISRDGNFIQLTFPAPI